MEKNLPTTSFPTESGISIDYCLGYTDVSKGSSGPKVLEGIKKIVLAFFQKIKKFFNHIKNFFISNRTIQTEPNPRNLREGAGREGQDLTVTKTESKCQEQEEIKGRKTPDRHNKVAIAPVTAPTVEKTAVVAASLAIELERNFSPSAFPPTTQNRIYYDRNGRKIAAVAKGKSTGSMVEFLEVIGKNPIFFQKMVSLTKIYDDLPKQFIEKFTNHQLEQKSLAKVIPGIFEGALKLHTKLGQYFKGTPFDVSNYASLGFTEKAYQKALGSSVGEFFLGRVHVCYPKVRMACVQKDRGIDIYSELLPVGRAITIEDIAKLPEVPVFSVCGAELRFCKKKGECISFAEAKAFVSRVYPRIMYNLLFAAEKENMESINLIGFGLGVFLGNFGREEREELTKEMLKGYAIGVNRFYEKSPDAFCEKIRFFGAPHWFTLIENHLSFEVKDAGILQKESGDAFQDALTRTAKRERVGFVNAGDGDWLYQLKYEKSPGQQWESHTLYDSTSDEYVALISSFSMMGNRPLRNFSLLEKSIIQIDPYKSPEQSSIAPETSNPFSDPNISQLIESYDEAILRTNQKVNGQNMVKVFNELKDQPHKPLEIIECLDKTLEGFQKKDENGVMEFKEQSTMEAVMENDNTAYTPIALLFANEHHCGGGPGIHYSFQKQKWVYDGYRARAQEEENDLTSDFMVRALPYIDQQHSKRAEKRKRQGWSHHVRQYNDKAYGFSTKHKCMAGEAIAFGSDKFAGTGNYKKAKPYMHLLSAAPVVRRNIEKYVELLDKNLSFEEFKKDPFFNDIKGRMRDHLYAGAKISDEIRQKGGKANIILGPFGCGAFAPKIGGKVHSSYIKVVADYYKELIEGEFSGYFDKITMAVPSFSQTDVTSTIFRKQFALQTD